MFSQQVIAMWLMSVVVGTPPAPENALTVDGLVRLIESVDVPSRRDGRLEKLTIKEGMYIKKGDNLGRLDESEAALNLKKSELELQLAREKAESEIAIETAILVEEVAKSEFIRVQQAKQNAPSSVSITEYDRLRLDAEKSTNELVKLKDEKRFAVITSQTKAVELDLARLALNDRQLLAPLDGIVVQLYRHEGEWVHVGEKIARVVRIDRLRVEAYVGLHSELSRLEKAEALLTVESPASAPQHLKGDVVLIHPEAAPINGQIRVWAEIENRGRLLRPGQRGRLKIFPQPRAKQPGEPVSAITPEQRGLR